VKRYSLLQVDCGFNEEPIKVQYENQLFKVASLLEKWRDTGCWWTGESEKAFYRIVLEEDKSVREIFYDLAEQQWYLYKTYD
jgi:hypothetical protein